MDVIFLKWISSPCLSNTWLNISPDLSKYLGRLILRTCSKLSLYHTIFLSYTLKFSNILHFVECKPLKYKAKCFSYFLHTEAMKTIHVPCTGVFLPSTFSCSRCASFSKSFIVPINLTLIGIFVPTNI